MIKLFNNYNVNGKSYTIHILTSDHVLVFNDNQTFGSFDVYTNKVNYKNIDAVKVLDDYVQALQDPKLASELQAIYYGPHAIQVVGYHMLMFKLGNNLYKLEHP